jgi:hypothetical protein
VNVELSQSQVDLVLTSLEFTKSAFERASYPTHALKKAKVKNVVDVMDVLRKARKQEEKEV